MTSTRQPDPAAPLVIVNRHAARLANPARRAEIVDAVRHAVRARTSTEPAIVDGDQDAARAALDGATEPPLIVAVGGDGTVRGVVSSRVGRTRPVAIVPGGTGNVLAASLGIRGIGPALDAIRHGGVRTIDVGEARWGRPGATDPDGRTDFLVACGMGLDARVMAAAAHEWKRRLGLGAYVGAAVRELSRLETADFHVTADGVSFRLRGLLILVANLGELVPGRVGPRRPIDPGDGHLDLIVVGGGGVSSGLRSAARLLLKTGEIRDDTIRIPVRQVRVEADPPQPIQTDGDHHPVGWLEAEIAPAALSVVIRAA